MWYKGYTIVIGLILLLMFTLYIREFLFRSIALYTTLMLCNIVKYSTIDTSIGECMYTVRSTTQDQWSADITVY